ncbi:MAG: DUF4236 domain-containing protein [Cyclobacteriaceae bacterium]|nr:DUF4236 domain-containing protein [Cyclobacteriaceae bacterium]
MKFRKRVRLFPGLTLNISKSGISTTVGVPGASVNFNRHGAYLNTGIPGTGLYDRRRLSAKPSQRRQSQSSIPTSSLSARPTDDEEHPGRYTCESMQDFKREIIECYKERIQLKKDIQSAGENLKHRQFILKLSKVFIIGFFTDKFERKRRESQMELERLETDLKHCFIDVNLKMDAEIEHAFAKVLSSYKTLSQVATIWDITRESAPDANLHRMNANALVERVKVHFGYDSFEALHSRYDALHMENADGCDFFIFPGFVLMRNSKNEIGLMDLKNMEFSYHQIHFAETDTLPADAQVVDHTWFRANKDGSPDRRFKDNYKIPICLYGQIEVKTQQGLYEVYNCSNHEKAEVFVKLIKEYQRLLPFLNMD